MNLMSSRRVGSVMGWRLGLCRSGTRHAVAEAAETESDELRDSNKMSVGFIE